MNSSLFNIGLISMPWSLFKRPSIQIGALKAYLQKDESLAIDCFHPYLSAAKIIGAEPYTTLCKKSWAGESLYSGLLYPENHEEAREVYNRNFSNPPTGPLEFDFLLDKLEDHFEQYLSGYSFAGYDLIGFSVCFSQLFSSLYAARRIKLLHPEIPIVFGGSSCVGVMGKSLLQSFDQIDYVIHGEGEKPFQSLVKFLQGKEVHFDGNVYSRSDGKVTESTVISDLNELPLPDYSDYFKELGKTFANSPFMVSLPIEFSRGCWWNKCSFCNLNLQWQGYRWKRADRMIQEVQNLSKEYQAIDFSFCDNALPPKEADLFFSSLSSQNIDYRFFAEIRVIKEPERLQLFKKGGLHTAQVGVEALSSLLLQKMKKGTSAIENLSVMKHCAENNIHLESNIIVEYPGTTLDEVDETLRNMEYAFHFPPPTAAAFFLGTGSPIEQNFQHHAINSVCDHPNNCSLFPDHQIKNLDLLIKDYRGDKTRQKKLWKPVRAKLKEWQSLHQQHRHKPLLSYRDGGSFLVIRQIMPDKRVQLHRLKGLSRKLYIFCRVIRSMDEIKDAFPSLAEKTILNFFLDLSNKRLLFQEREKFLALALHLQ